jgi:hypothetical protein
MEARDAPLMYVLIHAVARPLGISVIRKRKWVLQYQLYRLRRHSLFERKK